MKNRITIIALLIAGIAILIWGPELFSPHKPPVAVAINRNSGCPEHSL